MPYKDPIKRRLKSARYYQQHKEEIAAKYAKNSDKRKESMRKWYQINKEKKRKYRKINAEKINKYQVVYNKQRYAYDSYFRLKSNLRRRMNLALNGKDKSVSTQSLLGGTFEKIRRYIESKWTKNMTWENYGRWQLHHIIPICTFDLADPKQQKKCFHYTNLQPLWVEDHRKIHGGSYE